MLNYVYSSISGVGVKSEVIYEVKVKTMVPSDNFYKVVAYYLDTDLNNKTLVIKENIPSYEEANEVAKDFCNKLWGNGHRKKVNRYDRNKHPQHLPQEEIDILMKEVEE